MSEHARTRIGFLLESGNGREWLHASMVEPGRYRIENIPGLTFGVSLGDVVTATASADGLLFGEIVRRSGHATYQILIRDETGDIRNFDKFKQLLSLGCGFEGLSARYVGIDVPPDVDIFRVYAFSKLVKRIGPGRSTRRTVTSRIALRNDGSSGPSPLRPKRYLANLRERLT